MDVVSEIVARENNLIKGSAGSSPTRWGRAGRGSVWASLACSLLEDINTRLTVSQSHSALVMGSRPIYQYYTDLGFRSGGQRPYDTTM